MQNYATQSAFGAGRRASAPRARPIPGPDQQPVEFRSVFKPRPEQEPVCQLATQRRKLIQNSEWALIDTLEVDMYMREKEARAAALVALQTSQRQALDQQMGEVEAARRREERELQQEREVALAETARYKADQARRAAEERARNIALRNERQNMLQDSRAAKVCCGGCGGCYWGGVRWDGVRVQREGCWCCRLKRFRCWHGCARVQCCRRSCWIEMLALWDPHTLHTAP